MALVVIDTFRIVVGLMILLNAYLYYRTLLPKSERVKSRKFAIQTLRFLRSGRFRVVVRGFVEFYRTLSTFPFRNNLHGTTFFPGKIHRFRKIAVFLPRAGTRYEMAIGSTALVLLGILIALEPFEHITIIIFGIALALHGLSNLRHYIRNKEGRTYRIALKAGSPLLVFSTTMLIEFMCSGPIYLFGTTKLLIIAGLLLLTAPYLIANSIFHLMFYAFPSKFLRLYVVTYGAVSGFSFGVALSVTMTIASVYFGETGKFSNSELLQPSVVAVNMAVDGVVFAFVGWLSAHSSDSVRTVLSSLLLVVCAFLGSIVISYYLLHLSSGSADWLEVLALVVDPDYFRSLELLSSALPSREFLLVHSTFLPSLVMLFMGLLTFMIWSVNRASLLLATVLVQRKERTRGIVTASGFIWLGIGSILAVVREYFAT